MYPSHKKAQSILVAHLNRSCSEFSSFTMLRLGFVILCSFLSATNGIYVPNNNGQSGIKTGRHNLETTTFPGIRVYQNYTNVKVQQHANTDNLKKLYVDNYNQANQHNTQNPRLNEQFDLEPSKGTYNRPQFNRVYQQYPQSGSNQPEDNFETPETGNTYSHQPPRQFPSQYPDQNQGQFPDQTYQNNPKPQEVLCTINCIRSNQSPNRGYNVQFSAPSGNWTTYPIANKPSNPTGYTQPHSFYITHRPGTVRTNSLLVSNGGVTISTSPYKPMRVHTSQYQPAQSNPFQPQLQNQAQFQPKPQNVIIPENYYSGKIQNVPRPQQPSKKCPPGATGQYPYESSCHQFLNCWNGRGVVQNCAPGTLFNPETLECDFPDKVRCVSGPRTARYEKLTVKEAAACPQGFSGIVPHYQDCAKFLNCNNGVQVEMACAPGTLFDAQSNVCDHAYKVQCVNQDQREVRYIESSKYTQGPISTPSSPSYEANWGNQGNQNSETQQYESPGYGSVQESVKCPPGFAGLMPHPQDCSKFLSCANGMTFIMDCGPGTYFNPLISVCDHIRNVKCEKKNSQSSTPINGQTNQGVNAGQFHPNQNQGPSVNNGNQNIPQTYGHTHDNYNPNYGVNSGRYYPNPNQGQIPNNGNQNNHQNHGNTDSNYNPNHGVNSGNNFPNTNEGQIPNYGNQNNPQAYWNIQGPHNQNPISNSESPQNHGVQLGHYNPKQNQGQTLYYGTPSNPPNQGFNLEYYKPNLNRGQTPVQYPTQSQGQAQHTQVPTFYPTRPTATPSTTSTQSYQWNQNSHYTNPNQGRGYNPAQLTDDNLDQQIEDVWQTIPEPTTATYETLTFAQSANRNKVWPPPFPTKRVDNDYHFDYDDLVEVDVPLPIKPLPPSKKLIHSGFGNVQCTNQTFDCGNSHCISASSVCNGQKDCPNGSDELDCALRLQDFIKTSGTKLAVKEVNKLPNVTLAWCAASCSKGNCKGFNFRKHDGTCYILDSNVGTSGALIILPMYDYYENQQYTVDCTQTKGYLCKNQKCIPNSKICDGINDCGDGLDEKGCNADAFNYKLRLVGGEKHSGRLELEVFGRVGYICDDMFGLKNADVACRELGFSLGAAEVRGNSFFASDDKDNDTVYLMDDVTCTGNETSLRDCDFNGWGISNCKPQEIVGVVCKTPLEICPKDHWKCKNNLECLPLAFVCDGVYDCTDKSDESGEFCDAPLKLRLTDGTQGRLEIMHNGIWGTVCDDDFNDDAAKVVCSQLGLSGSAKVVKDGHFGSGSGPIWLDQVFCRGNESALEECVHWDWGEHNCEHAEDVGVVCNVKSVPGIERRQHIDIIVKPDIEDSQLPEKCGFRKDAIFNLGDYSDVHFRVVQAGAAQVGEYPWQASIRIKGKTKSAHWCGAIVVSSKYILTAAHCLVGYSKGAYFIVAGDYNVDKDEGSEQEAYIEDYILHPKFGHGNKMNNDIALIRLKGKGLTITKDVQPVCLPPADYEYPVGLNCTISGFGSIESGKSKASRELRAGWIPILSKDVCQMPHVYGDAITEGMLCAGFMENGVDACDGDSGGPLACLHEGVFKLFGITSWGQHCGYANKPGVYVNVAKYRTWIEDSMKELAN